MTGTQLLPRRGWRVDVHERLSEVIEHRRMDQGTGSRTAPVAVFDFDNTCIVNDIGELFSHYLIDEMLYRYDLDAFWDLIHPEDGRDELLRLTKTLSSAVPDPGSHPDFERYLGDMGALYGRRLGRAGKADCYEWAVRLHVGMRPDEVRRLADLAIRRELGRALYEEQRTSSCGRTTTISRGIRVIEEMHTLIRTLDRSGFDVWIVSASNIWTVEVFAAFFGVPTERVLGNRLVEDDDGVLTAETSRPVLFRQGKVEAIERYIGQRPVLAFGDAETDLEMLAWASDLAVVIDKGCDVLMKEARRSGWAVQPQHELHHLEDILYSQNRGSK
ncbi:MAG: HAD family hydrolase [Bradymonadaceae bacterium]